MSTCIAASGDPRALLARGASVIWAIGNTPMIDVSMLLDPEDLQPGVRLLAKLETSNPTGSSSDRVALHLIRHAIDHGWLTAGQRIIDASTGNFGISLAMLGSLLGFPVTVVMPANVTPEHHAALVAYGADVRVSAETDGVGGAVALAAQLAAQDASATQLQPYGNDAAVRAHHDGTGQELLAQVNGPVGAFVAALGSGATLMGVGRRLRSAHPQATIVAAEPMAAHHNYVPPVLEATLLDRRILVTNGTAALAMRDLAAVGVFAGVSSGAALHAARRIAPQMQQDEAIVMYVADGGWRYLSAGLWHGQQTADQLDEHMATTCWW